VLLYSLAFLQLANIMLMVIYVSQLQWSTQQQFLSSAINLIVLRLLVGTSSGISGIIVSHELIHRSYRPMRYLGRLLLCSVCYDHFTFSHHYGHHREVAKPHDIATARLGESFNHYWKRVLIENFRFAWSYEQTRLKTSDRPLQPLQVLKNRVLHGLLLESVFILAIFYYFGWIAGLFFLYQAFIAVRILEATNYYQHWGMGTDHSGSMLAWVNDSWVSCYALLGLTLHIDHHHHAARHFQNLHYREHGPQMPYGYFVMNFWVKLNNSAFQKHALNELQVYKTDVEQLNLTDEAVISS
jgi:alkane 1-monooxygenase